MPVSHVQTIESCCDCCDTHLIGCSQRDRQSSSSNAFVIYTSQSVVQSSKNRYIKGRGARIVMMTKRPGKYAWGWGGSKEKEQSFARVLKYLHLYMIYCFDVWWATQILNILIKSLHRFPTCQRLNTITLATHRSIRWLRSTSPIWTSSWSI